MKNNINIKTNDLTEDQRIIYNSPIVLGLKSLITWWPWTWKTTLLFLLAQKAKAFWKDIRIITCSNNLKNFLKDSFWDLDKHVKNAWGTWLPEVYPEKRGIMYDIANYIKKPFPSDFWRQDNHNRDIFLESILNKIRIESLLEWYWKNTIIFIDEAQDLPLLYFKIIQEIFDTVYIFADDKQKVSDYWSKTEDIAWLLQIHTRNKYYLDVNFRNPKSVYHFAITTWYKEEDIEIRKKFGEKVEFYVWNYDKKKLIQHIIDSNPWRNIAIITKWKSQQWQYSDIANIQIVNSDLNNYIQYEDFDIFCMNIKNNKWLEFDVVIVIDFDVMVFKTMEMYVSITRTKEKLYVLINENILHQLWIQKNDFYNITHGYEEEIGIEDIPF